MDRLKMYMEMKYKIEIIPLSYEDGGGWFASHPELHGCWSDGETPEEAIKNLKEAKEAWIGFSIEEGHTIPLPKEFNIPGSRFLAWCYTELAREWKLVSGKFIEWDYFDHVEECHNKICEYLNHLYVSYGDRSRRNQVQNEINQVAEDIREYLTVLTLHEGETLTPLCRGMIQLDNLDLIRVTPNILKSMAI